MGQLRTIEAELADLGYQIFAVSPDQPEKLSETMEENQLTYQLLTDRELKVAEAFGLVYRVDEATRNQYREYGIHLEYGKLPVPAVFVIDRSGKIQFQYANPDHRVRLDPAVVLAAARAAIAGPRSSCRSGGTAGILLDQAPLVEHDFAKVTLRDDDRPVVALPRNCCSFVR